jgi:CRISPR/Cas system CMR subunit Cmr6 (Cas7 group RAMP superfamily)
MAESLSQVHDYLRQFHEVLKKLESFYEKEIRSVARILNLRLRTECR